MNPILSFNNMLYQTFAIESSDENISIYNSFQQAKMRFTKLFQQTTLHLQEFIEPINDKAPKIKQPKTETLPENKTNEKISVPSFTSNLPTPLINSPIKTPFNIIINNKEECWLISFIHNLRANKELKEFIFKYCKNTEITKLLKEILNIHNTTIQEETYKKIFKYVDSSKAKSGGNDIAIIQKIFMNLDSHKIKQDNQEYNEQSIFHSSLPNTNGNGQEESINVEKIRFLLKSIQNMQDKRTLKVFPRESMDSFPYFIIQCYSESEKFDYINIENALLGIPNDHSRPSSANYCFRALVYRPRFLFIRPLIRISNGKENSDIKGLRLQKDILIKIHSSNGYQKYTLTGITVFCTKDDPHIQAVIKIDNKWFDADYESVVFYFNSGEITNPDFDIKKYEKLNIVRELNENETKEIIFNHSMNEHKRINLLYYQIVED